MGQPRVSCFDLCVAQIINELQKDLISKLEDSPATQKGDDTPFEPHSVSQKPRSHRTDFFFFLCPARASEQVGNMNIFNVGCGRAGARRFRLVGAAL